VAVFESPIQAAICRRALSLSKHRHGKHHIVDGQKYKEMFLAQHSVQSHCF